MLEAITQGLWIFILIIVFLAFVFFVFACWTIRAELKNLFRSFGKVILAVGVAIRRAVKDDYTRDEIIKNIGYFELRGNTKSADHWRSELFRKFPDDPYAN